MLSTYIGQNGLRYSFGFDSPNDAGVFIACGIVLVWHVQELILCRSRHVRQLVLLLEFAAWAAIVLTESRGAQVAALSALFCYGSHVVRESGRTRTRERTEFVLSRLVLLVMLMLATKAGTRWVAIVSGDPSAMNRLDIWSGALKLISCSPLYGWGHAKSGFMYIQCFQPVDGTGIPASMVSEPLTIAVENGLPVLFLIVFVLSCTLSISAMPPKHENSAILSGLRCLIITITVSSLMNPLHTWLWAAAIVSIVAVWCLRLNQSPRPDLVRAAGGSALASAILILSLFASGVWLMQKEQFSVEKAQGAAFRIMNRSGTADSITVMPDFITSGFAYGKALRSGMQRLNQLAPQQITIVPPGSQSFSDLVGDVYILGARAMEPLSATEPQLAKRRLILVCPRGPADHGVLEAADVAFIADVPFDDPLCRETLRTLRTSRSKDVFVLSWSGDSSVAEWDLIWAKLREIGSDISL